MSPGRCGRRCWRCGRRSSCRPRSRSGATLAARRLASHPAACRGHAVAVRADGDGVRPADGGIALRAGRGRAAARCKLGHADRGRAGADLQPPGVAVAPGLAVVVTVLLLNRLADALAPVIGRPVCSAGPQVVAVLFGISVLVFLIFFAAPGHRPGRSPGGPRRQPGHAGGGAGRVRLDRPLPVQYAPADGRGCSSRAT